MANKTLIWYWQESATTVFAQMDLNHDGVLQYDEFKLGVKVLTEEKTKVHSSNQERIAKLFPFKIVTAARTTLSPCLSHKK